jgi:hypothetical protein
MRCDRKINSLNPDLRETFSPLMFRSITFCATLFLLAINGLSQSDSTMVRFFVKGGDQYRVRIDDELMPKTNKFRLAKGSHKVEIWSFKHDIHKGTLETGDLDSTNYFADLKVSASYNSYLAKRDDYKRKVFFYKTAPILLSGVSLIALPVTFYGMKEKHEELTQNEFLDRYGQTTSASLDNTTLQYNTRVTLFAASIAGSVAGLLGVFILGLKADALVEPIFRQQNPFTLEYMDLSYNPQINRPVVGVTLRF